MGANVFVALCLIVSVTAYGYVRWRYDQISSLRLPSLAPLRAGAPGTSGGPPETVLIVGSDIRSNTSKGAVQAFGSPTDIGGQRSDTMMLLRVDPQTGAATLLSIPRDLWVSIPGTKHKDRINATFDVGPDLLIRAIHDDLQIDVNHYIEVDFDSFRGIVNAIGGVKVWFPTPARDSYSGLNITTAGCATLNGDVALAYVRARHYQYYADGYWHLEAESDLARIRRQQDFVKRVMRKTLNSGVDNPASLNRVIGAVVNNLTVDSGLKQHPADLARLTKELRVLGADALTTMTVPTTPAVIGGGDVLLAQEPEATETIARFEGLAPIPGAVPTTAPSATTVVPPSSILPAQVRVRVLNGSGVTHQASDASHALAADGFVVTYAGAADNYAYAATTIRYAPDAQDKAQLLSSYVVGGAQLQPDPTLPGTDVVLVTGANYAGFTPAHGPTGAAATPSTTGPTTTTTTQPPPEPGDQTNPAPASCQ